MPVPVCAHEEDIWGGISALLHKHRQVAGLYRIQVANLSHAGDIHSGGLFNAISVW